MPHTTFNQRLIAAKDRALATLEELCTPAFVPPTPIPTHREDGTSIPYDERMAMYKAQTARCTPDEKRVIVQERAARIRAANSILRTRPIDDRGNPLPTNPRDRHARRSAPRPEDARSQPAGSPAGTNHQNPPRSGGPTNDQSHAEAEDSSAFQAEDSTPQPDRQVNLRGRAADIARPPGEDPPRPSPFTPRDHLTTPHLPLATTGPPRPRPHPFDGVKGWHEGGPVDLVLRPRRRKRRA
jgi:hypothetical protein